MNKGKLPLDRASIAEKLCATSSRTKSPVKTNVVCEALKKGSGSGSCEQRVSRHAIALTEDKRAENMMHEMAWRHNKYSVCDSRLTYRKNCASALRAREGFVVMKDEGREARKEGNTPCALCITHVLPS